MKKKSILATENELKNTFGLKLLVFVSNLD